MHNINIYKLNFLVNLVLVFDTVFLLNTGWHIGIVGDTLETFEIDFREESVAIKFGMDISEIDSMAKR